MVSGFHSRFVQHNPIVQPQTCLVEVFAYSDHPSIRYLNRRAKRVKNTCRTFALKRHPAGIPPRPTMVGAGSRRVSGTVPGGLCLHTVAPGGGDLSYRRLIDDPSSPETPPKKTDEA
jgi:hypothetical protein